MALGLTLPLTEMSTRNISWRKKRPVRRADNLITFLCQIALKSGSLNLLEISGSVQFCNGIAILFTLHELYNMQNFLLFQLQILREHRPMLRYTYIGCVVVLLQVLFGYIDLTWGF